MDMKRILGLLVIVFFGFWMFNDPGSLAGALKNGGSAVWGMLTDLFGAVLSFIDAL